MRLPLFSCAELANRPEHISDQIHRLLLRGTTSARGTAAFKRQRRFAKCERSVLQLHDEIKDLSRFVNAQIVAFRKILKKYKVSSRLISLAPDFGLLSQVSFGTLHVSNRAHRNGLVLAH